MATTLTTHYGLPKPPLSTKGTLDNYGTLMDNADTAIYNAITSANRGYAILQNRQAQNTGGGTATSGSWGTVPINVEYEDSSSIVDSSSLPAFSLAAGTYYIEAILPFSSSTQYTQCRLYNVTDASVQQNIGSLDMYSTSDSYLESDSGVRKHLIGTFTIAGTKQFRIEYDCVVTVANTGHGKPSNRAVEVYAQVIITKVA